MPPRPSPLVLVSLLGLGACGTPDSPTDPEQPDAPVATDVVISPALAELTSLGETASLSAEVRDASGSVIAGTPVAWSSSAPAIARVSSAGLVTAAANGNATISAQSGQAVGTAPVTVQQVGTSVRVAPAQDTLAAIGQTRLLVATAVDARGLSVEGATFVWSSSDEAVATVAETGLVTAMAEGEATVAAEHAGVDGAALIHVVVRVASIEVTPVSAAVAVDDTLRLTAEAFDALHNPVPEAAFTWTTDGAATARVDLTGLVEGVAAGTTTVRASSGDVTGEAEVVVRDRERFTQVTTGRDHTCALSVSEAVFCWGPGPQGQLGGGGPATEVVPARVVGEQTFEAVTAASHHTCALTAAGLGFCWGANIGGALGDGTEIDRAEPTPVTGNLTLRSIAGAGWFACGVTPDDVGYCWGDNFFGNVGDGTFTDQHGPTAIVGGHDFETIGGGDAQACGITTDGPTYCWGLGQNGQLGDGSNGVSSTPVLVSGEHSFAEFSGGGWHNCALTALGEAHCWGRNSSAGTPRFSGGQLGDGTTTDRHTPVAVSGELTFTTIEVGAFHSCALTPEQVAYCWGSNVFGQLGDGTKTDRLVPHPVDGDLRFQSISAGGSHTCAVEVGGLAYCGGSNTLAFDPERPSGQLGIGGALESTVPALVAPPRN